MSPGRYKSTVWSSGAVQAVRLSKIVHGDKRSGNQAPRPPVFRGGDAERNHEKIWGKRNQGGLKKTLRVNRIRLRVKKAFNSVFCYSNLPLNNSLRNGYTILALQPTSPRTTEKIFTMIKSLDHGPTSSQPPIWLIVFLLLPRERSAKTKSPAGEIYSLAFMIWNESSFI